MMNWADLPEDLLSSVLSNLFAKDRHCFSLVCKSWNKAAKFSPFRHSPCLMYYRRSYCAWKILQYNGFFYVDVPEHLNRAEIRCVKYGWMLMSRTDLSMLLFDPFNNETIHLPNINYGYPTVCFFHPPTSRDCFIVAIGNIAGNADVEIGVLKRGENEWSAYSYPSKTLFLSSLNCNPVLHQGLLYFLDVQGNIATFDVGIHGFQISWIVKTKCFFPPRLCSKIRQHFLIKLHDEQTLLAVLVAHDERKVYVFRRSPDPNVKRWDPVENLRDKVLFVSRTASFAATVPWRSMANRIYFPKTHDDNNIVFYSLDTRRYYSCGGDYFSNKSYGFKDMNFATWISPTPTPEFPRDLRW